MIIHLKNKNIIDSIWIHVDVGKQDLLLNVLVIFKMAVETVSLSHFKILLCVLQYTLEFKIPVQN